jgi:hypothetical protein
LGQIRRGTVGGDVEPDSGAKHAPVQSLPRETAEACDSPGGWEQPA